MMNHHLSNEEFDWRLQVPKSVSTKIQFLDERKGRFVDIYTLEDLRDRNDSF